MIKNGLISVTFRKLSPAEIIKLVSQSGLQAIEWGGDIHVPHGDIRLAEQVGSMTRDAGIEIASYGSYYRVGNQVIGNDVPMEFERVLETASALQSPSIRVWAGNRGSQAADESFWNQVIEDSKRIADLAASAKVTIDFEFHGNTLTDTVDTAIRLLTNINHPNIRSHWQPQIHETEQQRLDGLQRLIPWLANLHVYQWQTGKRLSLEEGKEEWYSYLTPVLETGKTHYALLEFVKDDDQELFLRDAETLKSLLQ